LPQRATLMHVVAAEGVIGANALPVYTAKGERLNTDSLELTTRGGSLACGLVKVKAVCC
jgi:hypothetical protein